MRIVWNSKLGFDSLNKNFRNAEEGQDADERCPIAVSKVLLFDK